MQPGDPKLAEASSLKNLQSFQNDSHLAATSNVGENVERAGKSDGALPITSQPVVEAQPKPAANEKRRADESAAQESVNSTEDDEKKFDYPEGGLRGSVISIL